MYYGQLSNKGTIKMITGGMTSSHVDFYKKRVAEIEAQGFRVEVRFTEGTGDVTIIFGSEIGKW